MEIIELAICCLTVVVSVGIFGLIWLRVKSQEETEKNYREELRSQRRYGSPASDNSNNEPDLMTTILTIAQNNPELVQKVLGGLGGGNASQLPPKEN